MDHYYVSPFLFPDVPRIMIDVEEEERNVYWRRMTLIILIYIIHCNVAGIVKVHLDPSARSCKKSFPCLQPPQK